MSSDLDAAWHASLDLLIPHAALLLLAVTWQDGGPGIPRLELHRPMCGPTSLA